MKPFTRNTRMTIRYEDDLRLFRTHTARVVALVALVAAIILPLTLGDFPLSVLCYAGIATIGALLRRGRHGSDGACDHGCDQDQGAIHGAALQRGAR